MIADRVWASRSSNMIDAELAAAESSGLTPAEHAVATGVFRLLSVRQKEALSDRDVLQIVRGYAKAANRVADTADAARKIGVWRDRIGFADVLHIKLDHTER